MKRNTARKESVEAEPVTAAKYPFNPMAEAFEAALKKKEKRSLEGYMTWAVPKEESR